MLKRAVIKGVSSNGYRVKFSDPTIQPQQVVIREVSKNIFLNTLVVGARIKIYIEIKKGVPVGSMQIVSVFHEDEWVPSDQTVTRCIASMKDHVRDISKSRRVVTAVPACGAQH